VGGNRDAAPADEDAMVGALGAASAEEE